MKHTYLLVCLFTPTYSVNALFCVTCHSSPDEDSNLEPSSLGELDSSSLLGPMDEEERWLEALEKGELDDNGELKKEIDESLLTARQVGNTHTGDQDLTWILKATLSPLLLCYNSIINVKSGCSLWKILIHSSVPDFFPQAPDYEKALYSLSSQINTVYIYR